MKPSYQIFIIIYLFACQILLGQEEIPQTINTIESQMDTCDVKPTLEMVSTSLPRKSYCELLKGCIYSIEPKGKISGRIVKIEKNGTELFLNPITCNSEDIYGNEIGILSDCQFFNEKRGLFRVTWQVKFDFFVQIKPVEHRQSYEVVTLPRVYERRKNNEWELRSDLNSNSNLPDTIEIAYNNLISSIYNYLSK
jgi:hypothetical protein